MAQQDRGMPPMQTEERGMAYTSGFEHDIFISFSHDDNLALECGTGWVAQFREHLEIWLRRRGLKGLDIWWDKEQLRGNTVFDARIEKVLGSTALLVILHSRNYRQSDYCRKELDWFCAHAQRHALGLSVGDQRRILNLLINNIPHQEWTDESHWTQLLSGTTGIKLNDADKVDDFGDPVLPEQFSQALRPVVTAITETLEVFPKMLSSAPLPPEEPPPTVFLADVADTLRPFRRRLIKEIGARARVLDAIPPPLDKDAHDQAVARALEQADLSIHLLDQWPGREIDDDEDLTYPRHQADLAAAGEGSALIWVPETLAEADFEDAGQMRWLLNLEQASRPGGGYQFVRASREPFLAQVRDTLERIADRGACAQAGLPQFVIDTHRKDQRYAFALAASLAQRMPDLEVNFTKDADGPDGWRQFEEAVRRARDLIVLFGQVAPDWVLGRVEHAYKVAFGSVSPGLENIWVLLLPHCPGMPALPRLVRVEVLDNRASEDIAPDNLLRLLPSATQGGRG
jgi:hypothetical protein